MTLLGIVIEVIPVQAEKAPASIEVMLLGIVTEVNFVQPLNALSPIEVTV